VAKQPAVVFAQQHALSKASPLHLLQLQHLFSYRTVTWTYTYLAEHNQSWCDNHSYILATQASRRPTPMMCR
jgi:hypothetical protein